MKRVVIPQLLYGSEIWWKGSGKKHKTIHEKPCVDMINKTLRVALRVALSVYKITPIGLLHLESGIWDARTSLDEAGDRDSLRRIKLPKTHPVAIAMQEKAHKTSRMTSSYEELEGKNPREGRPKLPPNKKAKTQSRPGGETGDEVVMVSWEDGASHCGIKAKKGRQLRGRISIGSETITRRDAVVLAIHLTLREYIREGNEHLCSRRT